MSIVTPENLSSGLVVGLLLASGFGRRFDALGRRNKLLAPLPDGQTLVAASARALCNVLEHVAVVVPSRGTLIEAALSDLPVRLVRNARADEGMGASIAVGVAALRADYPKARGWLIALGDMPFVAPKTIRMIADTLIGGSTAGRARIVAPSYAGRRGHPVCFDNSFHDALAGLHGDTGATVLMGMHSVMLLACDDPGVVRDIDTQDDLTRARMANASSA
ncbi:MAG: nucleotidyltransferase family protein [Burkholderiaceae bacterium]